MIARRRHSQRGFTLIELMVALLVSSLLVGLILAIFSRMSLSYRGQQQIAGVQQVLAAARATIELDAKQAGLQVAQGFKIANDATAKSIHPPVEIIDGGANPDQIAFFYADTSIQGLVPAAAWPTSVTVDAPTGFVVGSLAVLVNVNTSGTGAGGTGLGSDPVVATYDACVLQISAIVGTTITFAQSGLWGNAGLTHCTVPTLNSTMLYGFVAHAYKIDTSTDTTITTGNMVGAARGVLLMSPTGGLFNNASDGWSELAFGFTDIQAAVQVYDNDTTDQDSDGDVVHEWYSGNAQTGITGIQAPAALPAAAVQMSISLVARTDRDIEGITTPATPTLTVAGNPNNNTLGNHASTALTLGPPIAAWPVDPLLWGARIYRYLTFRVDFRNSGVGR